MSIELAARTLYSNRIVCMYTLFKYSFRLLVLHYSYMPDLSTKVDYDNRRRIARAQRAFFIDKVSFPGTKG